MLFRSEKLKSEGRQKDIQYELSKIKPVKFDKTLAYLSEDMFDNYLHDMKIVEKYAKYNRLAILYSIVEKLDNVFIIDQFETLHNYIDVKNMILRKGAISAQLNEKCLIPMNMRDGSLLCIGKGNPDWNYSAPHGAGRLMSRSKAKEVVKLSDFKDTMKNVYTTSVNEYTIDESPFAYKPIDELVENIQETVDIIDILKPVYNFKSHK